MTGSILVDTNVLVYAYDRAAGAKQPQALAVLDQLARHAVGVMSTQVLAEFFVTVTRKLSLPLTAAEARQRIESYVLSWHIVEVSGLIILEAARGAETYGLSLWEAQIWAAARLNQISLIFSEDFNVGAVIEGVRFINPFAPEFQLTDWVR